MHRVAWALLIVALACARVAAQETGGSIESSGWDEPSSGSSFGGSSSGSSDWGSSSSSSSWSASYPTTDYSTSSSGSGSLPRGPSSDLDFLVILVALLFVVGMIIVPILIQRANAPAPWPSAFEGGGVRVVGPHAVARAGQVDLSALHLAIDWRARRFVQAELNKLAGTADTSTKEGRVAIVRAATAALVAVKLAWIYAGARNYAPMDQALARFEFQRTVDDLRASFRQELVRATDGRVVTVEALGVRAREHEGSGVVLVSIVVAARREIFDVDARRARSIAILLESLAELSADELVAVSVVWTPAAEEDRMSTAELEARHRHLVKIGDIGGRVFCTYCHGPHAQELTTCPHCGAQQLASSASPSA